MHGCHCLQDGFVKFDSNSDGFIDSVEFESTLSAGVKLHEHFKSQQRKLFKMVDAGKDDKLDIKEFAAFHHPELHPDKEAYADFLATAKIHESL